MNIAEDEAEDEIPKFECRLQNLEGLPPGVRTLIEQQDISRQLTELLFRKSGRAIKLAVASEARVARADKRITSLEQFKWKATWVGGTLLALLEFGLRYFLK